MTSSDTRAVSRSDVRAAAQPELARSPAPAAVSGERLALAAAAALAPDAGPPAPRFEASLVVLPHDRERRTRVVRLGLLVLVALAAAALAVFAATRSSKSIVVFGLGALGVGAVLLDYLLPTGKKRLLTQVVADADGLSFDGEWRLSAEEIATGYHVRDAELGDHVRLVGRKDQALVALGVRDEDEAHALLGALGLDATQRVAEFRLATGPLRRTRMKLLALGGLWAAGFAAAGLVPRLGVPGLAVLLVPLALVLLGAVPLVLHVGADGLGLRSLVRRRFLPYEAVAGVEPTRRGLEVLLRSGERVALDNTPLAEPRPSDLVQRDAIQSRIARAMASHRAREAARATAMLERGGRSSQQWLDELGALVGPASYRRGAVTPQALWDLVADSTARLPTRVAAAVALRASDGDKPSADDLRCVAKASASPAFRAALQAVAEDAPDEELGRALARVEREVDPR